MTPNGLPPLIPVTPEAPPLQPRAPSSTWPQMPSAEQSFQVAPSQEYLEPEPELEDWVEPIPALPPFPPYPPSSPAAFTAHQPIPPVQTFGPQPGYAAQKVVLARITAADLMEEESATPGRHFIPNPGPAKLGPAPMKPIPVAPVPPVPGNRIPAQSFLNKGLESLEQKAKLRDVNPAKGERSIARAAAIYTAWTGKPMSEEDGWRFMVALKQAREIQGDFHEDDYVDLASYAALLGEAQSGS